MSPRARRSPRVSHEELVAALCELADQVRELRVDVAALRFAVLDQLPDRVCDRLDDRGFAVAAPTPAPRRRGAS